MKANTTQIKKARFKAIFVFLWIEYNGVFNKIECSSDGYDTGSLATTSTFYVFRSQKCSDAIFPS